MTNKIFRDTIQNLKKAPGRVHNAVFIIIARHNWFHRMFLKSEHSPRKSFLYFSFIFTQGKGERLITVQMKYSRY